MAYKHVIKVNDVCQLLDKSKYPATHTQLGCTFTNNGDESFTINGTIQNGGSWSNPLQQITQNLYSHKVLLLTNSTSDIVRGEMKFTLQNGSSKWGTYNSIYTVAYNNYKYINIRIYMDNDDAGKTIDNAIVKFQFFDLTEMYGAGNEPTTVAEFREKFPNDYYPYSPLVNLSSNKRMIKVSDVCQLLDKSIYPVTTTNKGITITNNGDGSVTLNGTATSDGEFYSLQYINLINGHKYFICDNQGGSFANVVFTLDALGSAGNREGNIYTYNITSGPLRRNAYFYVVTGTVISNKVYKPQIFDLTEMFGAGHEPTTVAEFRQKFPNELYPYSPQCWLTSYKSAVICKTKNLFDVNNAVPYDFSTDDYDSNLVWLKDGIYTTRMNNYNLGSGLRIKNGWSLPAGAYTLSVKIVDFNNMENFVIGFRYKTTDETWKVQNYFYWSANYKVGDTIALAVTLPENTDVRLYLGYQNENGQMFAGYVSYKDIQVDQGPTGTSYVPYQHL